MPAIEIHLRVRVMDASGDALQAFLREAVPYYESPGGIRVRLLRDMNDPAAFIEVIEYNTTEDYEADRHRVENDPVMREYLDRWRALLDGPPTVETYGVSDMGA